LPSGRLSNGRLLNSDETFNLLTDLRLPDSRYPYSRAPYTPQLLRHPTCFYFIRARESVWGDTVTSHSNRVLLLILLSLSFLNPSPAKATHATQAAIVARVAANAVEKEEEDDQSGSPRGPDEKLAREISQKAGFDFHILPQTYTINENYRDPAASKRAQESMVSALKKVATLIEEGTINDRFADCVLNINKQGPTTSVQCQINLPWDMPLDKMRDFFKSQQNPKEMMKEAGALESELSKAAGIRVSSRNVTLADLKAAKERLVKFLTSPEMAKKGIVGVRLMGEGQTSVSEGALTLNVKETSEEWNLGMAKMPVGGLHTQKMARDLAMREGLSEDHKNFLNDIITKADPQARKESDARKMFALSARLEDIFKTPLYTEDLKPEELAALGEKWAALPPSELRKLTDLNLHVYLLGKTSEKAFITDRGTLMLPVDSNPAEVVASLPTAEALKKKGELFKKRQAEITPRLSVGSKEGGMTFYAHSMSHDEGLQGMDSLEKILNQGYRLKPPLRVVHFFKASNNPISYWNTGAPGKQTQVLMDIGIRIDQLPAETREKFFEKAPVKGMEAMK